ncbi:MAG: DUF456 family protein [Planctomycetes bacterium]|nr:DUF456 family protein [Planctomycetota bacterium]
MIAAAETNHTIAVVLTLVNLAWLATIAVGVPGTWLMVLSTDVAAWLQWQPGRPATEQVIGIWPLAIIVALALIGEVLEFAAGAAGARKAGGTRRSALAAIVGGLVGGIVGTFVIPIPLVGSLLGAAAGAGLAAAGAAMTGGKNVDDSVRIGVGAGVGRLLGTVYKLATGGAIWLIAAIAAFWP